MKVACWRLMILTACAQLMRVERKTEALHGNLQYAVLGVALVSFHGLTVGTSAYDPLHPPLQGEACLEQFWSKFWPVGDSDSQTSFDQGFFRIRVEKGHLLPEPQQVRAQTGELDGIPRSSVFEITSSSALKIRALIPQDWKGFVDSDELPNLAIRMPLPHALLLARGRWECYYLPLLAGRRVGLEYLKRRWRHLFKELRARKLTATDSRYCEPTTRSAAGPWSDECKTLWAIICRCIFQLDPSRALPQQQVQQIWHAFAGKELCLSLSFS